jgi:hypothetical protein
MYFRLIAAMATLLLLGCGQQRGTVNAAAGVSQPPTTQPPTTQPGPAVPQAFPAAAVQPPPSSSPVVSAEPAPDEAPQPAAAKPSAFAAKPPAEPVASAQPTKPPLVIPAGTRIRVRLAETLDTKHAHPGAAFTATLDEPVVIGDRVAVPVGTPFAGTILESKSSGRFRGRAELELTLVSFHMKGKTYQVRTVPDTRVSGSHGKRDVALMAGVPAAGAGIGALAGGGTGALIGTGVGAAAGTTTAFVTGKKNVKLPMETPMIFSLSSSVAIRRA